MAPSPPPLAVLESVSDRDYLQKDTNFIYTTLEETLPCSATVGFLEISSEKRRHVPSPSSGQHVLQDALANQLLAFPPWQEVLWRQRAQNIRMTTSCFLTSSSALPSCPHLAVLLQQDHRAVVNLKLAVVLQTSHLWRGKGHVTAFNLGGPTGGGGCCWSHLDVETLWWLHVLRDVQAFSSAH